MLGYIIKRILYMIPIMLGVITIVFILRTIMPGDPVDQLVASDATEEERQEMRESLGLDDPIPLQFVKYVGGIFTRLDFGLSYKSRQPVIEELALRFPITIRLAVGAVFLGTLMAIPLGVISAVRQNSWKDSLILVMSLILTSVPPFWLALMLMTLFSVHLGWFPPLYNDTWQSWVMPYIVVSLGAMSMLTRLTRSTMLEVIRSDYVRTARAKGQKENAIIYRHALRNALIPILAAIGNSLGIQLGGAIIIESIFGMPGIGKYISDAIAQRNFPSVQGGVIILALVFTLVNLIVDVSYTFVDPRLKSTIFGTKKSKAAA